MILLSLVTEHERGFYISCANSHVCRIVIFHQRERNVATKALRAFQSDKLTSTWFGQQWAAYTVGLIHAILRNINLPAFHLSVAGLSLVAYLIGENLIKSQTSLVVAEMTAACGRALKRNVQLYSVSRKKLGQTYSPNMRRFSQYLLRRREGCKVLFVCLLCHVRREWALLSFHSVCPDVCRSFRDLQPTTIDRSQPNLVGRYIPVLGPV